MWENRNIKGVMREWEELSRNEKYKDGLLNFWSDAETQLTTY